MAQCNLLTELLGLPNVRVIHYHLVGPNRLDVFIESTQEAATCPSCQVSLSVHDMSHPQMIRESPIWNCRCWLCFRPRRFERAACGNTFVERVMWCEPGLDDTLRYEELVYEQVRREPVAQVAQDEHRSDDIVQGILAMGKRTLAQRGYPRVKVLGLDEIAPHQGHGRYILIHLDLSPRRTRRLCRRRVGIESSDRGAGHVRGWTTSPNPAYRFVWLALSFVLLDIWTHLPGTGATVWLCPSDGRTGGAADVKIGSTESEHL